MVSFSTVERRQRYTLIHSIHFLIHPLFTNRNANTYHTLVIYEIIQLRNKTILEFIVPLRIIFKAIDTNSYEKQKTKFDLTTTSTLPILYIQYRYFYSHIMQVPSGIDTSKVKFSIKFNINHCIDRSYIQ